MHGSHAKGMGPKTWTTLGLEMLKRVPEHFFTGIRKVESVGGECIRIYCATETNGVWEDRFTILMPLKAAIGTSRFMLEVADKMNAASPIKQTH